MTNEEFKFWINGFLTLSDDVSFNHKQYTIIKNHAALSKAVVGELDESILQFMARLESAIGQKSEIMMKEVKEMSCFLSHPTLSRPRFIEECNLSA